MSSDPYYTSRVRVTRIGRPLRLAYLPAEPEPIRFGTHGPVAAHYGFTGPVDDPHATTLDYVVAATAG